MPVARKDPRIWSIVVGLVVSAALLTLVLTRINLGDAWRHVMQLNPVKLLWPLAITLVSLPLRPWRWRLMFAPQKRPAYTVTFNAFYISMLANNVLPARGGDVLRCFLVDRRKSIRNATRVLGTLGVEKVLDGLALVAVAGTALVFWRRESWLLQLVALAAAVFGGALALLFIMQRRPEAVRRPVRAAFRVLRLAAVGDKLDALLVSLTDGLSAVRSPRRILALVALTALAWALEAAFIWSMAPALGVSLSLGAAALVVAVLGLGMMAPAAPGYVGTYEFFAVAVLSLFGVTKESALALTLVMHAWVLLVMTVVGAAALAASGLRFSGLGSLAPATNATAEELDNNET